jgi:ABC-type lipoprotein export system ATPase subunit
MSAAQHKTEQSKPMLFDVRNIECRIQDVSIFGEINMNVGAGQSLLLLGPSGCGKTSLMNVMAGLLEANSGDIIFDGQSYASLSGGGRDKMRSNNFGFVFQKLHLIGHLSVAQNIALSQTKPDPARVQGLIAELGLSGKEKQKSRDLSVGEAQRVAIARAVANNPLVIFADEPTSALDDINTDKVIDLLFDQAQKTGASVIAATHDARIKNRFDTIVEMVS